MIRHRIKNIIDREENRAGELQGKINELTMTLQKFKNEIVDTNVGIAALRVALETLETKYNPVFDESYRGQADGLSSL